MVPCYKVLVIKRIRKSLDLGPRSSKDIETDPEKDVGAWNGTYVRFRHLNKIL